MATGKHLPLMFGLMESEQKKKTVTWAPDKQLESTHLIERAIYDDDPLDISITTFDCYPYSINSLILFAMTNPHSVAIDIPNHVNSSPWGKDSQGKTTQEEQE